MKILFDEISDSKKEYLFQEPDWLETADMDLVAPLEAAVTLRKVSEETVELAGTLTSAMESRCDRCGKEYRHPLKTKFYYIIKSGDHKDLLQKEIECSDEDCDTVHVNTREVDLRDVLNEQMVLAVPERRLCSENCNGLCTQCGTDLNTGECDCANNNVHSPFAVLKKLKK